MARLTCRQISKVVPMNVARGTHVVGCALHLHLVVRGGVERSAAVRACAVRARAITSVVITEALHRNQPTDCQRARGIDEPVVAWKAWGEMSERSVLDTPPLMSDVSTITCSDSYLSMTNLEEAYL